MTEVLLSKGANCALPSGVSSLQLAVSWSDPDGPVTADASALLLDQSGRVRSDGDFVFYNQPSSTDGSVHHKGQSAMMERRHELITVDLGALAVDVQTVAFAASVAEGDFGRIHNLRLTVFDAEGAALARYDVTDATTETAFVLGEVYRRGDLWKVRAVGQGWDSGLSGLAVDFGVSVDDSPEEALPLEFSDPDASTPALDSVGLQQGPTPQDPLRSLSDTAVDDMQTGPSGLQTHTAEPPTSAPPVRRPGGVRTAKGAAGGRKVPLFGARAVARDLVAENEQLRGALEAVGAMDLAEVEQRTREALALQTQIEASIQHEQAQHAARMLAAREDLDNLRRQVLDVRHAIDIQEFGLYDFEHPAESSASLADKLAHLRTQIKDMVRTGAAVDATSNFTFNGSTTQGAKMVKGLAKTMLAAYNAEAENAIKTVKAGGLATATARLDKVVEQVARNGEMIKLKIAWPYHRLRKQELELAATHQTAVAAEREAERANRAELREAKRVEDELRREREKLDKERDHYANALAALRARGDDAGAAELAARLAEIDRSIADVDYRAANIRAGYVYVISNVGAFGEHVVKIGMTRRLDPMDRVRELGDASVPFAFDVHALFFSEDAFGIEAMLHRHFAKERVNRINTRREFFYATPAQVLHVLRAHKVSIVEYRTEADADEFRQSREMANAGM